MYLPMSNSGPITRMLEDLLARANSGEEAAFDVLVLQATDRLRRLVRGQLRKYPHVRRWEETDDVFQAALIRLHRSLSEVRPDSLRGFYGLAATQIRRCLIDLARHYYGAHGIGANHHSVGGGVAGGEAADAVLHRAPAEHPPERLEDWTAFHEAIELLSPDVREVFELVWYGGLTQKDVAEMLGVSDRTIIRRMNMARVTLHRLLTDLDGSNEAREVTS
jgi:RNA polymerase sigma-70 factor (ECF subfamily)